jgi:hypothetical protein
LTLTLDLFLRNLPCFTFSIFSMNFVPCGYLISSFLTTSCEASPIRKISTSIIWTLSFRFPVTVLFSAAFQRGAKLRSFSKLPKLFKKLLFFFFLFSLSAVVYLHPLLLPIYS